MMTQLALLMVDVLMLPDGEMGSSQAQVLRYLRGVLVLVVLHHRYNSLPLAWFQAVYNLKLQVVVTLMNQTPYVDWDGTFHIFFVGQYKRLLFSEASFIFWL
jgi:hypothetical protein